MPCHVVMSTRLGSSYLHLKMWLMSVADEVLSVARVWLMSVADEVMSVAVECG